MKRVLGKKFVAAIKAIGVLAVGGGCFLFLLAATTQKMADDLWKQLGISQTDANSNIRNSLTSGNFQYYGVKNAKNIPSGNRIAVIRDLAAYAKKYAASDEFKKAYATYRDRLKPKDPYVWKLDVDSLRAAEKERIKEAIKATEANANNPNPKIKNAVPYRLEALRKELATVDDPNNRNIKARIDQNQRSNEQAVKQHQDQLKKYEEKWPADPRALIRARLQQVLDITADVDYNAELTQKGRYNVFVNPAYERKPKEWKLAFRAGKAATDEVRAIAQQWLQEYK